ncbi:unnamed protein product, partial [Coregonus sp. 'balchen']
DTPTRGSPEREIICLVLRKDPKLGFGGCLISLNKISLEGVTFTDAAAILQSCPDEVELIVSQPK